jgi:hypothetical protein
MNLNTYICDGDGWGWYVDIENSNYSNCINFIIIESYNNENSNSNKKMNYHLNRLETIHEYEYYEEDEKNEKENENIENIENIENNQIKNVEKGFLIKTGFTTIITTIFTYLSSFIFKLVH